MTPEEILGSGSDGTFPTFFPLFRSEWKILLLAVSFTDSANGQPLNFWGFHFSRKNKFKLLFDGPLAE